MAKVTIRGVDPKLWEQAKIECVKSKTLTLGAIVNEGLTLRQQAKGGKGSEKAVRD